MTLAVDEAQAVLERSDVVHDAAAVQGAYDRLAAEITRDLAKLRPVVVCVMLGGTVPTVEIMRRLRFPLELDYLHATRYRGGITGGGLSWKAEPGLMLKDRHVLVIDDILDEGHTLLAIHRALEAQGPASRRTAVLLDKHHDRRAAGARADYTGLTVEDRYVFGCGMDYKGWHRQLPAIHAVAGA